MALQMERRLAGENVFAGFFIYFFGERQRVKDREGKRKEKEEDRGCYDLICESLIETEV